MSLIIPVVQCCVTLYDYLLWNTMVTHITKTIRSTSNEVEKDIINKNDVIITWQSTKTYSLLASMLFNLL